MMYLPPLIRLSKPTRADCEEPTRSITAQAPAPSLVSFMICCAASGAPPSTTAAAPAFLAASRLAGSMSTTIAVTAHFLMQAEAHQPKTAGADDHRRLALERIDLLQGAESG